jgi:hypothetical protein
MGNSKWQQTEQWFMRGIGIALLVTALLAGMFGTLNNPQSDALVQGANIIIALIMAGAGAWALWWSNSSERIAKMLEDVKAQGVGMNRVLAGVQVFIGLFFLMGGGLVTVLLGLMVLASAGFFFWRSTQINNI